MVTDFTPAEIAQVKAAIAGAEKRTSGELFVIVETTPPCYTETALAGGILMALGLVPTLITALWLGGLTPADWADWPPLQTIEIFLALQIASFVIVWLLLDRTDMGRRLTPRHSRRARVHDMALRQFHAHGAHATRDRTGVLIFLSLPDCMAEIIADEGIYQKVDPAIWGDTLAALIAGVRQKQLVAGLTQAVTSCGDVLATHFPPDADNPNELPDHFIQI